MKGWKCIMLQTYSISLRTGFGGKKKRGMGGQRWLVGMKDWVTKIIGKRNREGDAGV